LKEFSIKTETDDGQVPGLRGKVDLAASLTACLESRQ
jgi:hypothetical protein